jgi:hypothetical protein
MTNISKLLNNGRTTIVLCLTLTFMILLGWSMNRTEASISAGVMYFVPQDIYQRNQEVTPTDFRSIDLREEGFIYVQEIGFTADWEFIESLIDAGQLDALIIHHEAMGAVNWEVVRIQFQRKGLIVAGIGTPGDELARLLEAPGLYERNRAYLDARNFDYFIYRMQVSGEPDDVANIVASRMSRNNDEDILTITAPARFGASVSHGYLSQEGIRHFVQLIDGELFNRYLFSLDSYQLDQLVE